MQSVRRANVNGIHGGVFQQFCVVRVRTEPFYIQRHSKLRGIIVRANANCIDVDIPQPIVQCARSVRVQGFP